MTLADRMQAPTAQSVNGNSHAASINAFNLQLRQQPWYQDWFRQQGLNPNNVRLSKAQRQQLEGVLAQHGVPLADGMNIDPAGNLNTPHGFASQPGWAKALEIAAPIAGSMLIPGVREAVLSHAGSVFGLGGESIGPTGTGTGVNAATNFLASSAPNAVAPAVAKTAGFGIGKILTTALPSIVNAGATIYGTHAATSANTQAAQLQAQAARDALDYTKTHDAQQRQDDLNVQNRNFALFNEAQARLDPYRRFGRASLDQLMRPIPGVGTLGARM